ncbi:hypothetical protein WQ54_14455 [Bacillus sp. SA1-12]|nr:hypothetical protein WQ54_14455 [Bacillus sp. SA1-12]
MPYNNPKSLMIWSNAKQATRFLATDKNLPFLLRIIFQQVFGSFGMAACRKWNRNLRNVKKDVLPHILYFSEDRSRVPTFYEGPSSHKYFDAWGTF